MIGHGTRDHLRLRWLADELEILLRDLPRRLHRLAAAAREEDLVQITWRFGSKPISQLDRSWMGIGPDREERQLACLRGCGLSEFGSSVAGLHGKQTRESVEILPPVGIPDVRALATLDGWYWLAGEARHSGEMHPQMLGGACRSN